MTRSISGRKRLLAATLGSGAVVMAGVAAAAIAAAAFAIPAIAFDDASPPASAMTRTEPRHASSIRPLRLQLTSFEPGGVHAATFRWRTIFGVPYGTTVVAGDTTTSSWDVASGAIAWAGFVAAEVALVGHAVVAVVRSG